MLTQLKEEEFGQYIDFAYALARDPSKSGYPAYFDGIKTKADFISRAKKSFTRPDETILLYWENGQPEGWIHCSVLADEHFVTQCACCIRRNTAGALTEYAAWLSERYPGFEWDVGIPTANVEAAAWLERAPGFARIDESEHYQFFFDRYAPLPEPSGVERVTEENFDKFRKIHQTIESDMYWNCQRILNRLSDWDLFIAEEDGVSGEIMAADESNGFYEIFAFACSDGAFHEGLFLRLLTRILNEGKAKGAKYLPFFVDTGDESRRLLPGLGFQLIGQYLLYRKRI